MVWGLCGAISNCQIAVNMSLETSATVAERAPATANLGVKVLRICGWHAGRHPSRMESDFSGCWGDARVRLSGFSLCREKPTRELSRCCLAFALLKVASHQRRRFCSAFEVQRRSCSGERLAA